jgi:hypothetical protein
MNQQQWLRCEKTPRAPKSSAKAKTTVNKMKGAATTAPPPSDESDEEKVEVETVVRVHPEVEQKNQAACSLMSKADENSGDDDAVTGIQSIMEASAAVGSLSGVATTITAVPSPSKSKTLPPPSDDHIFWLRFSELCRYKVEHGTTSVPRSKGGTNNVLANWMHYIRKRYKNNVVQATHKSILNGINFEWTAGQITKKGFKGWFAELLEYQKKNGTVQVLEDNKKNTRSLPRGETMQREHPSRC